MTSFSSQCLFCFLLQNDECNCFVHYWFWLKCGIYVRKHLYNITYTIGYARSAVLKHKTHEKQHAYYGTNAQSIHYYIVRAQPRSWSLKWRRIGWGVNKSGVVTRWATANHHAPVELHLECKYVRPSTTKFTLLSGATRSPLAYTTQLHKGSPPPY